MLHPYRDSRTTGPSFGTQVKLMRDDGGARIQGTKSFLPLASPRAGQTVINGLFEAACSFSLIERCSARAPGAFMISACHAARPEETAASSTPRPHNHPPQPPSPLAGPNSPTASMAEKDSDAMAISHLNSNDDLDLKSLDSDAQKLATMGSSQDLRRNQSVLSVLGVGFGLTNSWFGISTALVTGINSGGPILIVYGIILIALISTCVGISLSELASAYPNAGTFLPLLFSCPTRPRFTVGNRRSVPLDE